MKVAIPHWQGRVSPVFDVAGSILVVDIEERVERAREDVVVDVDDPQARAARLAEAGVHVLICGAISWPMELAVSAAGIEVISQACGEIEEILSAFAADRFDEDSFLMPGCCGRRRRCRERRRADRSPGKTDKESRHAER